MLHELAGNSARHGALSRPAGSVGVSWSLVGDDAATLRVAWREDGAAPVAASRRRGFGSRLIERTIARELKGALELSFPPGGLRCVMDIPLAQRP